jgi:ribulose-phosphate 3-epimerase
MLAVFAIGCSRDINFRERTAEEIFSLGDKEMKAKHYAAAAKVFEELKSLYPYSKATAEASRKLIECYVAMGDSNKAEAICKTIEGENSASSQSSCLRKLVLGKERKLRIEASLLSCDLLELGSKIDTLTKAGIDGLHIDIMDGHFVSNIAFGLDVVKQIRGVSKLPITVHLLVSDPLKFIDVVAPYADCIIIHSEGVANVSEALKKIKGEGVAVGLAINPATEIDSIEKYLHMVDVALIMGVQPGYGGQKFIPSSLKKIRKIKSIFGDKILIGIDGGVNDKTSSVINNEKVDELAVGSYLVKENTVRGLKEKLKILCRGV